MKSSHKMAIESVIKAIVAQDFGLLEADGRAGSVRADDMRRVISEYGRTLVTPPADWAEYVDQYIFDDGTGIGYDVPLWTAEEGESDLKLIVDVKFGLVDHVVIQDLGVL